ncbi:hypothetical protein [Acetivibrio saccincola]|nr:hypothetical protein [Acetivibrio saccincola]
MCQSPSRFLKQHFLFWEKGGWAYVHGGEASVFAELVFMDELLAQQI